MPIYEFRCEEHGVFEEVRSMGEASSPCFCAVCNATAKRVFGNFLYVEDRCRFARNPRTGKDWSDMLGAPYPKDRKERNAIYAQKGIEPVSSNEMPAQWQTAMNYAKELKAGAPKLSKAEEAKLIEPPDMSKVKSIKQMVQESGMRLGV